MGPEHVVNVVDEAVKTALSRHGVAHINIPKDIQTWEVGEGTRSHANIADHSADLFAPDGVAPPTVQLQKAADIINAGSKVAIMAGRGCLGARDEVEQLARIVAGPVIKPLLGKGVLPDDSPYTTGGIGLLGTAPSQDALKACDTLIIAGAGMPYMEFYPEPGQAKCVQIDYDPERIGLRYPADVGLVGDCGAVLRALLPLLDQKTDLDFLQKAQDGKMDWDQLMQERGTSTDLPMKPQVVAHHLSKLLRDDAIVSSDSGTIATWSARHVDMRGDMMFSLSGSLATMANSVPYSIGAAIAYPGRQVISIVGDGGFTMLMGEMATLVKYKLPVKVIIFKNNSLGQIKWEQIAQEGNPEYGVDLQPIDFAMYARACGAEGFSVDDPTKIEATLREALATEGPAVVECVIDPNEPPMPGHITIEQAKNFALAMARGDENRWDIVRTVIRDKVREVI
jgi:pyruvate dehydrogenase (quinone)